MGRIQDTGIPVRTGKIPPDLNPISFFLLFLIELITDQLNFLPFFNHKYLKSIPLIRTKSLNIRFP